MKKLAARKKIKWKQALRRGHSKKLDFSAFTLVFSGSVAFLFPLLNAK